MFRYVLALCTVATACGCGDGYHKRGVSDAAADFEAVTGLKWPESAKVVAADDSHVEGDSGFGFGPGVMDGELFIVFDADKESVKTWAAEAAPWDVEWQKGPVPEKILHHTHFSTLHTAGIIFAAHERGASRDFGNDFAFWDGELLMLDLSSGRVWLASWNK